jgi:Spy/CpxP family protein refolding chaperone
MYADAGNRMRNESNWDQQDAKYKQDIADKQKALDNAKQQLEDIQEQARKAGTPASVREP